MKQWKYRLNAPRLSKPEVKPLFLSRWILHSAICFVRKAQPTDPSIAISVLKGLVKPPEFQRESTTCPGARADEQWAVATSPDGRKLP
jgi:hypothetical protein